VKPVRPAVFLDRDGVLVADDGLLTDPTRFRILPGVPQAMADLHAAGFVLVMVTNQPVVARGMIDEAGLECLHAYLVDLLIAGGAPRLAHLYACPHHPKAEVVAYRLDCACRKPFPGMLTRAAAELGLDLPRSVMVGDRITDIAAGAAAGCQTVQVLSGRHDEPPITSRAVIPANLKADHQCADLPAAAAWILERHRSLAGGMPALPRGKAPGTTS
jgi:D-glycero-D-manno-heptose 1,7-bisphosphate phosphatase